MSRQVSRARIYLASVPGAHRAVLWSTPAVVAGAVLGVDVLEGHAQLSAGQQDVVTVLFCGPLVLSSAQ